MIQLPAFQQELLHQQWLQDQHDRNYHPDIAGMTNLDKLKHYHLHCSKYLGSIHEQRSEPEERLKPVIIDALLIALAAANALKLDLGAAITICDGPEAESSLGLTAEAARLARNEIPCLENLSFWLIDNLIVTLARLARALEKNEHFEDHDAHLQCRQAVILIARHLILAAGAIHLDIPAHLVARRQRIREQSLFAALPDACSCEPFPQA